MESAPFSRSVANEGFHGIDFAHEPMLRHAGEVLRNPKLGPVLYWQYRGENTVIDGTAWQATEWRTIPDYQGGEGAFWLLTITRTDRLNTGRFLFFLISFLLLCIDSTSRSGFLLDAGVHQTAMLRTVLPIPPTTILSATSLHRTHLPPHDTIMAIALPSTASHTSAHGPPTKLKGIIAESDIPAEIGKSAPHGTILLTFATPDLPSEFKVPGGLVVTTLHAQVVIEQKGGKWVITTTGAKDSGVKSETKDGPSEGVEVEVGMFGRAVVAAKQGHSANEEDYGTPRGALWDLAVVEACLTSNGKPINVEELIAGK